MDVEGTIEFILQQHARTESMMQRLEAGHKVLEESQQRSREEIGTLTASQTRLAENLITLTDLVRQISEQNERDHQRFDEFHREVDERFNALIQMMDEWIRGQRNQNGRP